MAYFNGKKDFAIVIVVKDNGSGGEADGSKTCILNINTNYACADVKVSYIYHGQAKTQVIPENTEAAVTVDCNTNITLECSDGLYFTESPWGKGIYYASPQTLTTPAEEGTYPISFDNT